jgi:hypothetical protein
MSIEASQRASQAIATSNTADYSEAGVTTQDSTESSSITSEVAATETTDTVTTTSTSSYSEVSERVAAASISSFNEVDEEGITPIEDEQVPLAVKLDDGTVSEDNTVSIEDEKAPLSKIKSGVDRRSWWYWILIIISAITGKTAKDKRKELNSDSEEV